MHMVGVMCLNTRAVRTGNYALCKSLSFRGICQVLFRTGQAQLCQYDSHIYVAEMSQLERTYPEIWSEFSNGNRVVNKTTISFCAIGPDHAQMDESDWRPCWHNTE